MLYRLIDRAEILTPASQNVDKLMLGNGEAGYLLYAYQARIADGGLLVSTLDLLNSTPEAHNLLAQFIDYARSDRFQPQGSLDFREAQLLWHKSAALEQDCNGYDKVLGATESPSTYDSFAGELQLYAVHADSTDKELAWQTQPVDPKLDPAVNFTLTWAAATGHVSEPDRPFTLYLNGQPLLDLHATVASAQWQNPAGTVTLDYEVLLVHSNNLDSSGFMHLTVPACLVKPGQPAELAVRPAADGSLRWVGLYESSAH